MSWLFFSFHSCEKDSDFLFFFQCLHKCCVTVLLLDSGSVCSYDCEHQLQRMLLRVKLLLFMFCSFTCYWKQKKMDFFCFKHLLCVLLRNCAAGTSVFKNTFFLFCCLKKKKIQPKLQWHLKVTFLLSAVCCCLFFFFCWHTAQECIVLDWLISHTGPPHVPLICNDFRLVFVIRWYSLHLLIQKEIVEYAKPISL